MPHYLSAPKPSAQQGRDFPASPARDMHGHRAAGGRGEGADGRPPLSGCGRGGGHSAHGDGGSVGQYVGGFNPDRLTQMEVASQMSARSFTTDFSREHGSERGISRQSTMHSVSSAGGDGEAAGGRRSTVSSGSGMVALQQEQAGLLTVRAICGFVAQKEHEVSLDEGEVLVILRKHHSGWWDACSARTGKRGWLPSNHVEEVDARTIVLDQVMGHVDDRQTHRNACMESS